MFITLDFYIIYTFLELKEGKWKMAKGQNGKMAKWQKKKSSKFN